MNNSNPPVTRQNVPSIFEQHQAHLRAQFAARCAEQQRALEIIADPTQHPDYIAGQQVRRAMGDG